MPEIGNARAFHRFLYASLGRGAIGYSSFGLDDSAYFDHPLGAANLVDRPSVRRVTMGRFR